VLDAVAAGVMIAAKATGRGPAWRPSP